MRRLTRALLVILVALCAACSGNLQQCVNEAANKPTDAGVRLAVAQCNKQYPTKNPFDVFDQRSEIDRFLGVQQNDTAEQWWTLAAVIGAFLLANALVALVLSRFAPAVALFVLMAERLLCGAVVVIGVAQILPVVVRGGMTENVLAQVALKGIVLIVAILLFFAGTKAVNHVYLIHHGVPHPSIGRNPWAFW